LSIAPTRDETIAGSGLFPGTNKSAALAIVSAKLEAAVGVTTSGVAVSDEIVSATEPKSAVVSGFEAKAAATLLVSETAAVNTASLILQNYPLNPVLHAHCNLLVASFKEQVPFPLHVFSAHTGFAVALSLSCNKAFLLASLS